MKIINTSESSPDDLTPSEREWCYNGLDCCVTAEVLDVIFRQLDDHTANTYNFSKALQGPVLEMRLRGVLMDQHRKAQVLDDYFDKIDRLESQLDRIICDGVGMYDFNWQSPKKMQELFYGHLGIPPIKRQGRPTTNREAREKMEIYLVAKPILTHINAIADIASKIKFLKTGVDPDGRVRTSYNIAGTNTGRFSSSYSEFGTGGNLQNVEEGLRSVFISDPGWKFAKFDAKSGESFVVGAIEWNLFKDGRYLDAVESGDVHTAVAKLCWPNLGWTGELKRDKAIAERIYYRHYTYRFMCKKLGHGSNYGGQPATLAGQAKLPETVVRDFQPKYFRAFPSHISWHGWVDTQLKRAGFLINLTGRKRWFFGRRNDPAVWREAVAYDPQGSLADIVNRAMLRIWRTRKALIMMQDHDAITFMYPEEMEDEIIPELKSMLVEEIPLAHGRSLAIPYDCKVGWNKGEYDEQTNPDGLKDYEGHDKRERRPQVSIMDRILSATY